MGRNAKLRTAAAVVAVLALITIVLKLPIFVPIAIVVVGVGAILFLLRQDDDDSGGTTATKAAKAKKGKARLDEILDDQASKAGGTTTTTNRAPAPAAPPSGGLPTWTPGSIDSTATADDSTDLFETSSSEGSWDTWEKEWPADADALIVEDDDPLSSLDRLDDIDPVAEVERIEAADDDPFASLRADIEVTSDEDTFELDELTELDDEPVAAPASSGSAFSFGSAPAVINEEVSTADDIMAASTATELHVEDAGDSELARLLAKVQARLSAYE